MYHFRIKVHTRGKSVKDGGNSQGVKALAAIISYRTGARIKDPATGKVYHYAKKSRIDEDGFGIVHTEVMRPPHAPEAFTNQQVLNNAIEAAEKRVDSQLMREAEISLPRDLTHEEQVELVRSFVHEHFVSKGMIAIVAVHDERAADGGRNPHAHVLLTMRSATADGFGKKMRDWDSRQLVKEWRAAWAEAVNQALAAAGSEQRVDHRSHKERNIEVEPDVYVGPGKGRDFEGVFVDFRRDVRDASKERNIETLELDPAKLVRMVARDKATFTAFDLELAARRATGLGYNDERVKALAEAALVQARVEKIHSDGKGHDRYATREQIMSEATMARAAKSLAVRQARKEAPTPPRHLSDEQQRAFSYVVGGPDLTCIHGVAGAGKTTVLRAIADEMSAQGYNVRGLALAGVAQKNLSDEAGIPASTIQGLFYQWNNPDTKRPLPERAPFAKRDVILMDEAGLVASRDMERVLSAAEQAGARVVLIGDTQQLQAIEAGAAFRAIVDTHGAAELKSVRRQNHNWMRDATKAMAQGDMKTAIDLYDAAGQVQASFSHDDAKAALINAWVADRQRGDSQIILGHSVADVKDLNRRAREVLRDRGELGRDVKVTIRERVRDDMGEILQQASTRTFATGDRILFTSNDNTLDVKNGSLGDVRRVEKDGAFTVRLDDGRLVEFNVKDHPDIERGYAFTTHKAQGSTVDRAYVLAAPSFDRQIAYTAMSRHRENATLFYAEDQFGDFEGLKERCSRDRLKDTTLHYLDDELSKKRERARGKSGEATGAASAHRLRPALRAPTPPPQTAPERPAQTPEQAAPRQPSLNPNSPVARAIARRKAQELRKDRGREFES